MTDHDELEEMLRRFQPASPPASMRAPTALGSRRPKSSSGRLRRVIVGSGALAAVAVIGLFVWSRGPSSVPATSVEPEGAMALQPLETLPTEGREQSRVALGLSSGGAQVLLLEFVDWLCPAVACAMPPGREMAERYATLMPGAVRYLVSDFPMNADCNPAIRATVPGHEGSCVAAAAVRLAREAGRERAMIDWLGQHRSRLGSLEGDAAIAAIKTEAARLLDGSPSDDDYVLMVDAVRREAAMGGAIGVSYVPGLYINGILAGDTSGPWTRDRIEMALKRELARRSTVASGAQGFDAPVRVGGDIGPVERTRIVLPFYPRDPDPGVVAILELTVQPSGVVDSVEVLRASQAADITAAAVDAALQWEYEPLELGGEPVWFIQTVVIYGSNTGFRGAQ